MNLSNTRTVQFGLFPKAHMIEFGNRGLVIEKERDVICVYATDTAHQKIYASIPLGAPKLFRKTPFTACATDSGAITVEAGSIRMVFNFTEKRCAVNMNLRIYGSEYWGENCGTPWNDAYNALFGTPTLSRREPQP